MVLNNIKSLKEEGGFTIVELLVVIVVIAILAAITIVSYTGITARANAARAVQNADSASSVAMAYAADPANSGLPADAATLNGYTTYARMPSGVTAIVGGAGVLSGTNGLTSVVYQRDADNLTTGACVGYWDYAASTPIIAYKYIGPATAGNLNVASPTCT